MCCTYLVPALVHACVIILVRRIDLLIVVNGRYSIGVFFSEWARHMETSKTSLRCYGITLSEYGVLWTIGEFPLGDLMQSSSYY